MRTCLAQDDGDVLEGQVTAKYTVNYTVHTELQCTEYLAADQLLWIDWLLQASVNRLQCQLLSKCLLHSGGGGFSRLQCLIGTCGGTIGLIRGTSGLIRGTSGPVHILVILALLPNMR